MTEATEYQQLLTAAMEKWETHKAREALDELKRRHGGDAPVPCPDCGSFEHFEC